VEGYTQICGMNVFQMLSLQLAYLLIFIYHHQAECFGSVVGSVPTEIFFYIFIELQILLLFCGLKFSSGYDCPS
jgi:hypothetical protein